MLFWTILKVAVKSLVANKLRSILAMLGMIIGVGAVIAMMALGNGAQKEVMNRLSTLGTNLLVVRPGQRGSRGVTSGTQENLTVEDAREILEKVPGIYQIAPVVSGSAQVKYLNKNTRTNILGTSTTYLPIRNFQVELGRSFTKDEVARSSRVAIIGQVTAENLFGESFTQDKSIPLDETIKIKGINFKIVGVMKSKGDQGWYNPDDQAMVPYSTAMKQLFGVTSLREIGVQVSSGGDMEQVQSDISKLLRNRHRIQQGMPDDFYIRNMAEIQDTYNSTSRTFTFLLAGIANISLLVGGIGIMNIMLVTVTERTKEIGIRKAIGAKERDILLQFLIETMLMSSLGGIIGLGVGVGIAETLTHFTDFKCIVSSSSILLAITFSAAVGIFFGFYPARRAAKLNPIEALRYE